MRDVGYTIWAYLKKKRKKKDEKVSFVYHYLVLHVVYFVVYRFSKPGAVKMLGSSTSVRC